jgi:hypothetical protein
LETVDDYRWRLVKEAQKRLPEDHKWYGKKLGSLWNNGFEQVENDIYRDVRTAGERPDSAPEGQLREVTKVNPSNGLKFVEFLGKRSFIHDLKSPVRFVRGFLTAGGRYYNTARRYL